MKERYGQSLDIKATDHGTDKATTETTPSLDKNNQPSLGKGGRKTTGKGLGQSLGPARVRHGQIHGQTRASVPRPRGGPLREGGGPKGTNPPR